MPIGYSITVVLVGLATAFALKPPRRPSALRKTAWLPAAVVNEIPLLAILFLGGSTALAFAEGGIDSAAGWACVGLAAVTAGGLVFVARRAALARPVLGQALEQGLGSGGAAGGGISRPPARTLLGATLAPWFNPRGGVERVSNLPYGEAGRENLLDVYARRGAREGAPTLIHFHGGGYSGGGKSREGRALLYRLAREGWTCVSANYRLRPRAGLFEQLVDAKRVISWARRDAGERSNRPGPLFVAGSSAGGHLAALAALTPDEPALQPGFEWADTSVSGAICLYAYLGNYYGMGADSSLRGRIRADAPPFFLAQGELDTYSPRFVGIARGFAEELGEVSASPVVYAELPGAQHAFDLVGSVRFEAVIDAIVAFTSSLGVQRPGGPDASLN